MVLLRYWLAMLLLSADWCSHRTTAAALNDGLWDGGPDASRDMCVAD
jgi:hypothetical protein